MLDLMERETGGRDVNFLSCEYFVAIYRAGSIRKAAGELFISQQALSGQLNKLERELGIQLMLRTTPVELTEAGEQFLLAATRILYIRDTLLKNLEQRRSRQSEEVRLGILSSGAPICFPDFLSGFKERNPQYQVQVVELDEPTGILRELPPEVPLAMGAFPGGGKLTHVPVMESEQFTVTVHDRLLERFYGPGWPQVAQELAAEGNLRTLKLCPFVLKRAGSFARQREDQMFFDAGFKPRSETETGQLPLAVDICRRGDGALILPAPVAQACFGGGKDDLGLKSYPLRTQGDRWQLTVCYPRERTLSPAELDFIQAAVEYYRDK